ncbi:MAG: SMP-30/gluconolactonase/LRE family protein, partial [Planctomycetota bacterium]
MNIRQRLSFSLVVLVTTISLTTGSLHSQDTAVADPPKIVAGKFGLLDGAAWDGGNRLYVPDVKSQQVYAFSTHKRPFSRRVILRDLRVSGTALQNGKLYLSDNGNARIAVIPAIADRVFRSQKAKDWVAKGVETLAQFDGSKKQRPNDLVVAKDGTVYVTFTPEGIVRRIGPDRHVSVLASGLNSPNGIGLSPDETHLYVSSFKSGALYRIALDRAAGQADDASAVETKPQKIAQLPETQDGFRGDGMTLDRAGNVYVTGADAVHVFDPDGISLGQIRPPARPINVTIANPDGRELFISTFDGMYTTT